MSIHNKIHDFLNTAPPIVLVSLGVIMSAAVMSVGSMAEDWEKSSLLRRVFSDSASTADIAYRDQLRSEAQKWVQNCKSESFCYSGQTERTLREISAP